MTLGDLIDAIVSDVAKLPIANHAELQVEYAALQARTKKIGAVLDAALEMAYGGQNDTGTSHIKRDGYDVKITIPKKVEYDQELLESLASDDAIAEYVDYKLTVSETRYKGAPQAVRDKLDSARTIKAGKAKFEIEKEV